jgi:hypothetical protein
MEVIEGRAPEDATPENYSVVADEVPETGCTATRIRSAACVEEYSKLVMNCQGSLWLVVCKDCKCNSVYGWRVLSNKKRV